MQVAAYYFSNEISVTQLDSSQSGTHTRAVECLYFSNENIRMGTAMPRNMQA